MPATTPTIYIISANQNYMSQKLKNWKLEASPDWAATEDLNKRRQLLNRNELYKAGVIECMEFLKRGRNFQNRTRRSQVRRPHPNNCLRECRLRCAASIQLGFSERNPADTRRSRPANCRGTQCQWQNVEVSSLGGAVQIYGRIA